MKILRVVIAIVAVALVAGAAALWQGYQLPEPQIASAEGKIAPDFLLRDQEGREFRLHDRRGERVVLVFYRAHW